MARVNPRPGQIWRSDVGGPPQQIVAVDDRFAFVKRADEAKKRLARVAGSYPVAFSEFENWTLLQDVEEDPKADSDPA